METWSDICPFKKEKLFAALPWRHYINSPCWCPYILLSAIWENMFNNQDSSSFVIISLILLTSTVYVTMQWYDEKKFNSDHYWGLNCNRKGKVGLDGNWNTLWQYMLIMFLLGMVLYMYSLLQLKFLCSYNECGKLTKLLYSFCCSCWLFLLNSKMLSQTNFLSGFNAPRRFWICSKLSEHLHKYQCT